MKYTLFPLLGVWLWLAVCGGRGYGQEADDDLMEMLEATTPAEKPAPVKGAFKATRLVQQYNTALAAPHHLNLVIGHRLNLASSRVVARIAFEYGAASWLTVGIGGATYEKSVDGFVKVPILRQGPAPVFLTYCSEMSVRGLRWPNDGFAYRFSDRLAYVHQLVAARKFSSRVTFQVMGALVHRNLSPGAGYSNDNAFVGMGGRVKISDDVTFSFEYSPRVWGRLPDGGVPVAVGVNIQTGGHVFQLLVSNGPGLTQKNVLLDARRPDGTSGWLYVGFNLYRTFSLVRS